MFTIGAATGTPDPEITTAFLQRLANPLQAFDPKRNPYLTVDWSPIDVTVFNGEAAPATMGSDPDVGGSLRTGR